MPKPLEQSNPNLTYPKNRILYIGMHATWDVYNCNAERLSFVPHIKKTLHAVTATLDLMEVSEAFKQFEPVGVTGFILLAESHISIHTWPEHGYAAVDVFSCKPFDVEIVTEALQVLLESDRVQSTILERGDLAMARNAKTLSR